LDQLYGSLWRSGYRQHGSPLCSDDSFLSSANVTFVAKHYRPSPHGAEVEFAFPRIFLDKIETEKTLVVCGGEVLVSRGESGEDEGVDEGLRVV